MKKKPRRVVLGIGHFACDGWSIELQDMFSTKRLPIENEEPLWRKRVRLVAEVLE